MSKIERPDTAFVLSQGARRPRQKAEGHLAWVRALPSVLSGARPCEACHVRYGSPAHGKRETGMQEKPDDAFVVPLTTHEHRTGPEAQHANVEEAWWRARGIDPLDIALRLWAASGDDERGDAIIREANKIVRVRLASR